MANVFYFNTLSATRKIEVMGGYNGAFYARLGGADLDILEQKSRGFTREQLEAIRATRYVFFSSRYDYDNDSARLFVIPEQFNDIATRAMFEAEGVGSFSYAAISRVYSLRGANSLMSDYSAFCRDCGVQIRYADSIHTCGAPRCSCGADLVGAVELERGSCRRCLVARLWKVYGYHSRPNYRSPKFEHPEKRGGVCHLGAEIEIGGSSRFQIGESVTMPLSKTLNDEKHPERVFVEFESDGSLDGGVECILAPTTFDGLNKRAAAFDAFYAKARELGGKFGDVNGMHFHVDRDFFGNEDERAKAAILIDFMVFKYFDFFAAISRRKAGNFGYAYKKDGVNSLITAAAKHAHTEHSLAVNGSGKNTVEIRIFGGKIETGADFLAVADIIQAIARWAKYTSFTTAANHTPEALTKYYKNAARVLAFIENAREDRPITTAGEAMRAAVIASIKNRIEGGAK
jgi:hypothetical protein